MAIDMNTKSFKDNARRAMAANVNLELLWMVLFIRLRIHRKI